MSFRILPKDPKFFELFILDGDNLAAAATALHEMVDQYDKLESRVANIQGLEKRGDEIDEEVTRRLEDAFVTPFDREDIHELVSRLDDVVDGIQSIAEAFVIYGVKEPTAEARRLAAILDGQGGELAAALRKFDGMKDLERHFAAVHQLEKEADGLSRAAMARLFHDELAVDRSHQVARPVHLPRGHHRRGRGRGRGDGADVPQGQLGGPDRAVVPPCRGSRASCARRRSARSRRSLRPAHIPTVDPCAEMHPPSPERRPFLHPGAAFCMRADRCTCMHPVHRRKHETLEWSTGDDACTLTHGRSTR